MKKIVLLVTCIVLWLSVDLIVFGGDGPPSVPPPVTTPTLQKPPVEPPPVQLTPTPTLPFDADGAKRMPDREGAIPGSGKETKPAEQTQIVKSPERHVVIGMYERMLEQVCLTRRWPVGDLIDGCISMHDGGAICQ